MSYSFVKRQNAIGWDWYLESDDCSSWVSQLAKEVIESLESENAKLKEERDGFKALSELKDAQFNNVLGSVKILKSENAKLANIIQRAYKEMWNVSETWAEDVLGDDMRKFGIEVK